VPFALPDRPLRRQPYEHELRAAVDYSTLDLDYQDAVEAIQDYWLRVVVPEQIAALSDQVVLTKSGTARTRVTRTDMARLAAPELGAEDLADLMLPAARSAAAGAVGEAIAQGVAAPMPSDEVLRARLLDHATAVAVQGANGVSLAAQRKAVQMVGGGRTPAQVAAEVVGYLQGLKHQWTKDQLAGAVQSAQNSGRFQVWENVPDERPVAWYASELLDSNTCDPCAAIDGREYDSLEDATAEYPSGGYMDCLGGPRCRGTVVAVFDEL
jgi:hypothetical protein